MRQTLIAAALILQGCATMNTTQRPSDFPKLREIVVRTDANGIRQHCKARPYNVLFGGTLACTLFDFKAGTYTIVTMSDAEWLMQHEREHGQGYDHPGETIVRDAWAAYKLHQRDAGLWADFNEQRKTRGW